MQRAARRVAEENLRLRSLLARYGVLQDEVEFYLQSFNKGEASIIDAVTPALHQSKIVAGRLYEAFGTVPSSNRTQCGGQQIVNSNCVLPAEDRTREISITSRATEPTSTDQNQHMATAASRPAETHYDTRNGQEIDEFECPDTADCFCPPTLKPHTQPSDSGLEISCERAAAIITEMRGDVDMEAIRASLGCAGRKECNVRNSTVLQIMDEG
jgi:hypothetical protein